MKVKRCYDHDYCKEKLLKGKETIKISKEYTSISLLGIQFTSLRNWMTWSIVVTIKSAILITSVPMLSKVLKLS